MDNWLLIIVGVIFLVSIVVGYVRGVFKIGISLVSAIITMVIMLFLTPYVGNALIKYTPLDDVIADKCIEIFMPELSAEQLQGVDLTGTPLEDLNADQVAQIGEVDLERLGITESDVLGVLGEIPKDVQIKEIENAEIPQFFKDLLLENNNSEIYKALEVSTFPEYAAGYISRMVINIVAFLAAFLLAIIIVKALLAAVDIIGELPMVGTLNHFGGAAVGVLTALLLVWLGFLILTLLYSTDVGMACFEQIDKSSALTFLYEKNIIMTRLLSFK